MNYLKICIVISTYNRVSYLKKLLFQIKEQVISKEIELSTIVINEGSRNEIDDDVCKMFPFINIIQGTGNWWWTKCMNQGFKRSIELGYDFVLVLNDDVEILPNYITVLLNDYATLPPNSILGSASVSINQPHQIESAGTKQFIKWRFKFVPYFKGFKPIDENFIGIHRTWTLSGRGTLIPVKVFHQIGLYDENLIQYGSDDEFCIRANLRNIPVFISWNALIYNHTNLTSKGSAFKKEGFITLLKSFFNKYSVNSLRKQIYLYLKYGYKSLLPFYLSIVILGTIKAYYFNYRK